MTHHTRLFFHEYSLNITPRQVIAAKIIVLSSAVIRGINQKQLLTYASLRPLYIFEFSE